MHGSSEPDLRNWRRKVNRACLWVFIRPGSLSELGGGAISSFSNPVRMNHAYNLLNLHP
ncbi:hypothetical protein [Bordetella pertussis]|uniref:hypothetical protein n=1 Tax=Bordetella pertussis TaxID=520 RepID=UPI00138AE086|nr:hypothetical protein [Bordetella pertussis]